MARVACINSVHMRGVKPAPYVMERITQRARTPALFNQLVSDFLSAVEAGKWAEHPLGDTPYSTGSR